MKLSNLSSRERLLAALKRQSKGFVPFSPHIAMGPFHKEPLFWYDQFERAKRLLDLGIDPVIEIWMPDICPHPSVEIKTWREKKDGKTLITKEYHTPAGVLRQVVHETDDWCDSDHAYWIPTTFGVEKRTAFDMQPFDDHNVSRRLEPWVKSPDDIEKLKYIILPPTGYKLDEWRMDCQRAIEFAKKYDLLTVFRRTIIGDAYQWFCDIPWFMMQLLENPKFVQDFFDIFLNWSMQLINYGLEFDIDVFQYRGWYETPPFWSPKMAERLLMPAINKQIDLVHSNNRLFSYLLPEGHGSYADILKNSRIDVLQGIDPRKLHDGDLGMVFSKIGSNKCFWGGIDSEVTLQSSDKHIIDKAVKDTIESLGGNGGLILSAILCRSTPHQGIMYMIDAWNKYKKMFNMR